MKRNLNYILKEAFRYSYSTLLSGTYSYLPVNGVPILCYHSIDETSSPISVSPKDFHLQMAFLKDNNYKTISLSELSLSLADNNSKKVVITFDDGFENNYKYAFPILKEFGHTATVFVTTNTVGGKPQWLNKYFKNLMLKFLKIKSSSEFKADRSLLSQLNPKHIFYTQEDILERLKGYELLLNENMLSWEQIKEMNTYGISFGCHTFSHPFLTNLEPDKLKSEILDSKVTIEQKLCTSVDSICYPYGYYNNEVIKAVKEQNFKCACSSDPGISFTNDDQYSLKRVGIRDLSDLKFYLSRGFNWYLSLRKILHGEKL